MRLHVYSMQVDGQDLKYKRTRDAMFNIAFKAQHKNSILNILYLFLYTIFIISFQYSLNYLLVHHLNNPTKIKMHFSILFVTLFPILALAAPSTAVPKRQVQEDITTAMLNWLQDTGFVSSYLDQAASLAPSDVLADGALALAAENDERNHKAVLDNFFVFETDTPNQNVINANTTLITDGNFESVVMLLEDISVTGNLADIMAINFVRCANVLPAIDAYFIAVAQATGSSFFSPAIRPLACAGI